jgi:uncharacterized membrane protein
MAGVGLGQRHLALSRACRFTSGAMKLSMSSPRATAIRRLTDGEFYLVLIMLAAALTIVLVAPFALELHRNFLTIACDTADIQCAIVNTLHGHFLEKNGGPSLLASHTSFLLLAVIPAYVVVPSVDTLFVLQVAGVYATVVPIYLVALELIGRPLLAFGLALIALTSPILVHMALAPVHLETWIAAAVFWAIFFYLRGSIGGYMVSMLVAVCCAEQAAMLLLGLGASLLLIDDGRAWRRRFGAIAVALSFAWLVLDLILVHTLTRHAPGAFNIFAYNYASFGVQGAADLPGAVLRHPGMTLGMLLNPQRWAHLFLLVGLPLLLALLSGRSALLLLPMPVYLLMSDQEFYLYFHAYYYTFAFVAGYVGLMLFVARRAALLRLIIAVLGGSLLANVLLLAPATGYYFRLDGGADPDFTPVIQATLRSIPISAGVYTAHRYSAYLSNREVVEIGDLRDPGVDFDAMVEKQFPATNVHASDIRYIVCDYLTDQCGWRDGYLNRDQFQARSDNVDRLVASGAWRVYFKQGNLAIIERVK